MVHRLDFVNGVGGGRKVRTQPQSWWGRTCGWVRELAWQMCITDLRDTFETEMKVMAETSPFAYKRGDKVHKIVGDYRFKGIVLVAYYKLDGKSIRYDAENEDGVVHIFNGNQLKAGWPEHMPANPHWPPPDAEWTEKDIF